MNRMILLAVIALLTIARAALAQAPDDLRGTWAMQVDDRNLVVLHLEGEAGHLSGTLSRPMGVNFGPAAATGTSVTQVTMPLFTAQVQEVRSTASGRVFALRYETNNAGEILVKADGADRTRLGFAATAAENSLLPMVRVSAAATVATDWNPGQSYLVRAPVEKSNAEMAAILAADQADRQAGPNGVDWKVVSPRDEARRLRVRILLDAGQLRTADDYYGAAYVFQHGARPEDFLLAHVFAMTAMTLGRSDAAWIATATLDRYLQNIDRSQIFGTQYTGVAGGPMTQGNYDAALIPDSLRLLLGVPTREQQQERLKQFNARP